MLKWNFPVKLVLSSYLPTLKIEMEGMVQCDFDKNCFYDPIYDHCNTTDHFKPIDNLTIGGREDQNPARTIKE